MNEEKFNKILKYAASANELSSDFERRLNSFKLDFAFALSMDNPEDRSFLLRKVRDELNGYFTKVYQIILSGTALYKKEKKRTKHREKIREIFHDDISILDIAIDKLTNARNHSGHPIAYQLNLEIFNQSEFIKKVLEKVEEKLTLLLEVDETLGKEMILMEKKRQERWLEKRSKLFRSNKSLTIKKDNPRS